MELKNGTLLQNGRYRIESVLGQGGFGITYEAVQVSLNRKVAVKEFFMKDLCERDKENSFVSVPSTGSRGLVDRFRNKFIKEARNIALFKCPYIVSVIDVFEENGTAYYVMDYISGGTLNERLKKGVFSESEALRYIRQVASALEYVHKLKMMHLDVKPANILLDSDGNAVLIDFGLSKQYDNAGQQTSTTPVGISHGYAPMEQYKRGGVSTFSPATDIYSLGATLYKMLTGVTPPEASDLLNEGLPALPANISAATSAAVVSAMQPIVNMRPQSIAEFLALLESDVEVVVPKKNDKMPEVSEETIAFSNENDEATTANVSEAESGGYAAPAVECVKEPSNSWLRVLNAFFITSMSFLALKMTFYLFDGPISELYCIEMPVMLSFAVVLIFVLKSAVAKRGAVLLAISELILLVANLEYYDGSLSIEFGDITSYSVTNLIIDVICMALAVGGTYMCYSGVGACRQLRNAVVAALSLNWAFGVMYYVVILTEGVDGYWWNTADGTNNMAALCGIAISIYLISLCSSTLSKKIKNGTECDSVVWILVRVFVVAQYVSFFLPMFSNWDNAYGNISLVEIMGNYNFGAIGTMMLYGFAMIPQMINLLQSFVKPKKWLNCVASSLALLFSVILIIINSDENGDWEAGMYLFIVFLVAQFVMTFIPAGKNNAA